MIQTTMQEYYYWSNNVNCWNKAALGVIIMYCIIIIIIIIIEITHQTSIHVDLQNV